METNTPSGSGLLALFDPQVQHRIVTGIQEWVEENEPVIVEVAQVTCGLLVGAAQLLDRAHTAICTLLAQPQAQDALVAFLEWAPRFEAAARAAERLVALREEAEKGAAAFVANDKATVRAFTCEVLRLRPYDATFVWLALVYSDWRAQWDPITFLRRRVWAMRQEERRREVRWARRNPLQFDSGWREGRVERKKLEEFFKPKRRTLSLEEHVEVLRMVHAGELSVDAARLLEARLAGVTRRMWKALGWDEQRMERVWKELYLAMPILKRRLGN